MPFYSARLHVVCIVDSQEYQLEGKYTCDYQFILFRANSFEHAFERALALGHEQETFYKNEDDKDVRWALNAVEQIYELGNELDGLEVGSLLDVYMPESPISISSDLSPESKPPQWG